MFELILLSFSFFKSSEKSLVDFKLLDKLESESELLIRAESEFKSSPREKEAEFKFSSIIKYSQSTKLPSLSNSGSTSLSNSESTSLANACGNKATAINKIKINGSSFLILIFIK